jgi:hypothetical protein
MVDSAVRLHFPAKRVCSDVSLRKIALLLDSPQTEITTTSTGLRATGTTCGIVKRHAVNCSFFG